MSMEASASEQKIFAFYNFALIQRCILKTISFFTIKFCCPFTDNSYFIIQRTRSFAAFVVFFLNGRTLPLLRFFNSACFSWSVYQYSSKSGGNSAFYSMHLNVQHGGGGGHLESSRLLPVSHF
jgi:hypothetical protein